MVNKPRTVDEVLTYVWELPDTFWRLQRSKAWLLHWQRKPMLLLGAPDPEVWVGTLKAVLKLAGILALKA